MGKASRLKKRHLIRALERLRSDTGGALLPEKPRLSPSHDLLGADLIEADYRHRNRGDGPYTLDSVAKGLSRISHEKGEWCGIPVPIHGEHLMIEHRNPWAKGLEKCGLGTVVYSPTQVRQSFACRIEENGDDSVRYKVRNRFWSWHRRSEVIVFEDQGRITWGVAPGVQHVAMDLHTMGCADAWSLETELTALAKLRELVSHHQFRQYFLTGMFIETSSRSGVKYIFRRVRPTIAIGTGKNGQPVILCVLCQHPLGFYSGSWAGALTPSDDVIGALMLMRGDEHMLWRRSNQHPAYRPEAGL